LDVVNVSQDDLGLLGDAIDRLLGDYDPEVVWALRMVGLTPRIFVDLWGSQCMWGILHPKDIYLYTILLVIGGLEFQVSGLAPQHQSPRFDVPGRLRFMLLSSRLTFGRDFCMI